MDALKQAEKENYEVAILDDGLQDKSIDYDIKFITSTRHCRVRPFLQVH